MITIEDLEKGTGNGDNLNDYIKAISNTSHPRRHKYYKETKDHAESMGVHIEGCTPKKLLEENRPNEPQEVREYRLNVWKSVTKSLSAKVLNTISRIFNPKLFVITFPEHPATVSEDETIDNYLNQSYGVYRNFWVFIRETLLKKTLSDPNALCVVLPENIESTDQEYFKPIPKIYKSKYLVDFVDGWYYTLYHPEENTVKEKEQGFLIIITKNVYRKWVIKKEKYILEIDFQHNLDRCPAFRLGGEVEGEHNPYWFSSFVSGIQPHWDKVVTMVSDLDGSTVNHLFPEKYEWQDECPKCNGTGKLKRENIDLGIAKTEGQPTRRGCTTCGGAGVITNRSPFGAYTVKRQSFDDATTQIPIPPAGYISKDIAPLKELKLSIDDQIYLGYAAINMEVLHRVGANQSGIAKTIDREDIEAFMMRVSSHMFDYEVRNIVEITALFRYAFTGDIKGWVDQISISKPKEFGALNIQMIMDELKQAGSSNVSSNYYRQLESELINRKFSNNEYERKKNQAIIKLKPFPNKTIDQLMSARMSNAIREIDLIRNENIDELVVLAIEESNDFLEKTFKEQLDIVNSIIIRDYMNNTELPSVPVE